jgi:hypothetical protein
MDGSRAEAQLCRYFGRSLALSEKSDHLDLTAAQALSCRVLMFHDDLVWVQKTHGCTRAFRASAWRLFVFTCKTSLLFKIALVFVGFNHVAKKAT